MQTAYTAKAKKAIDIATRISKSLHHSYIGTEHILLGLLKEGTGVASQVLADNGVEYDKVLELIEELIAPGNAESGLSKTEKCPSQWEEMSNRKRWFWRIVSMILFFLLVWGVVSATDWIMALLTGKG